MLKCFTLENSLQGLCLLLKKVLPPLTKQQNPNNDKETFSVHTVVLDQKTGETVEEYENVFDFSHLSNADQIVLFQLNIEGGGQIIMDLFSRSMDPNRSSQ